ncbi:phage-related conserved hypothetical protein [Bordetella bronchiseptica RB50]|uniref:DUF2514 family protein n=3 Tax=Bordetella TaxID=517 RepID=A0A0T7CTT1_BORP1|nr:DUF2514 family protein [Bordetella bronchiseptica]AZR86511.1 hypothetical protein BBB37_18905 [Bordetella pertussis]CAE32737.1 phage-related conserved hypothetical protein [Bordetella bronchiseptica RB50]CCJ51987.1 phage-related conserved hypothetical protein [Bordetella bronchiseptica 253]CCJ65046.1 phage-related conserved hypothetical protein [Bordetella pertussis 18323]MCE7075244.1 hypothetical protein [Bordetella bronchiseptica]
MGAWRRSAVVALLSAALAAGAAWTAQGWRKDAAIARQAAAFALERDRQAQATVAALEAVREEGRRRTAAVEKARDDAQELAAAAAANAVGARAERDRLRTHANALARAAVARDPDAADGSPTGASAVDLLAYMLSRVSGRAEALAGVADRARIAGLTCERAYEAVRGNVRP